MNLAFLKFDYPDLTCDEALWQLARDIQPHAYFMVDGRITGIRNPRLAKRHLEVVLLALEGSREPRRRHER